MHTIKNGSFMLATGLAIFGIIALFQALVVGVVALVVAVACLGVGAALVRSCRQNA